MISNILLVTPKLSTHGGVSSFWNALLPEFKKYEDVAIHNLQIGGHKKNIFGAVWDQWKLRKCIKQNIDLVFLNPSLGSRSFVRDALFAKQCIAKKVPFVVFFHAWSLDFEQKVDEKYSSFFLKTFGHAQKIFVLSEDFKKKILEWGYKGEIVVETTNVDVGLLGDFSIDAKIENSTNASTIKILFLARLIKEKGIFEMIEAFGNLSKKYDNLELTIAGDGRDFEEVSSLVAKDDNIIVTGYVEGESKKELLYNSHIYCLPSYTEGLPISVLDAMAFGMPIITTNVGGLKQFFKDNEMGYLVEAKNAKQLEEKLELLLNDKENTISMGTHNANYIKESLLSPTVAKRLHNYLLEIMKGQYMHINNDIIESFDKLKIYCESEGFKGWDPYDGLNSKFFKALQLDKIKFLRLAWIQIFKRNPMNIRKLALVPKEYNPKGLALFLTGYCNLYKVDAKAEYLEQIHFLSKQLIALQSRGFSGACWGYNFDWQSRAFFLPKETPTVVATSFIASALMDAYDITNEQKYLDVALSSANFIMNDLNRTFKEDGFIFSYSPFDNTSVYNASLLGSKLLARIYSYNKDETLLAVAKDSVLACARAQREDGAWIYGEMGIQNWVDSFHTGYNLECINDYQNYSGDTTFQVYIDKGLDYYLKHFFLNDGTPKYYDNKTYPIDIHAPAQLVATLARLGVLEEQKELVSKVLKWTIEHMQDDKEGYFYYQLKQGISSKIPYMRWAQAWMFYAFTFLGEENTNDS